MIIPDLTSLVQLSTLPVNVWMRRNVYIPTSRSGDIPLWFYADIGDSGNDISVCSYEHGYIYYFYVKPQKNNKTYEWVVCVKSGDLTFEYSPYDLWTDVVIF